MIFFQLYMQRLYRNICILPLTSRDRERERDFQDQGLGGKQKCVARESEKRKTLCSEIDYCIVWGRSWGPR